MNVAINKLSRRHIGRLALEKTALEAVCACQYYDLVDCMDTTSSKELIDIITQRHDCEVCGWRSRAEGGGEL